MKNQTIDVEEKRLKKVVIAFTFMSVISPALIAYSFYRVAGVDFGKMVICYLICAPLFLVAVWSAYLRKMRELKKPKLQNISDDTSANGDTSPNVEKQK